MGIKSKIPNNLSILVSQLKVNFEAIWLRNDLQMTSSDLKKTWFLIVELRCWYYYLWFDTNKAYVKNYKVLGHFEVIEVISKSNDPKIDF